MMRTINLVGKAYIMKVHYKTALGTTVLENTVIRNRKKQRQYPQIKQITVQENHNIHTYSFFCLVVLAVENARIHLLLVTYRNEIL